MIRTTQRFAERRDLKRGVEVEWSGTRGGGLIQLPRGHPTKKWSWFYRHIDATDKANRSASEVRSIGERLFPHNIPVRLHIFSALVEPVMLYGAEVTGYIATRKNWTQYYEDTLDGCSDYPKALLSLF